NFPKYHVSTMGLDFDSRVVLHNSHLTKVQIWDTAGQERYRAIAKNYYRRVTGIIVVFDITQRDTYEKVSFWLKEIQMYDKKNPIIVQVGNKIDLKHLRMVETVEAKEYAESNKIKYFETSAKLSDGIDDMIMYLLDNGTDKVCEITKLPIQKKPQKPKSILS